MIDLANLCRQRWAEPTLPGIVALLATSLLAALSSGETAITAQKRARQPAITAIAFSPDGNHYVAGSQSGVVIRLIEEPQSSPRAIKTELEHVHDLAFAPLESDASEKNSHLLAIAGGSPAEYGEVELWTWPAFERVGVLEGHEDVVYAAAWVVPGKQLATASADRTIRIWDVSSRRSIKILTGHSGPVLSLSVSPDNKLLGSGSVDQTIRLWSTADWSGVGSLNNHLGPVHDLAFRPTKDESAPLQLASAGGDNTVRIWQPSIGRLVRIIRHPSPVFAVAWSSDGERIISASQDGHVRYLAGTSDKILAEQQVSPAWLLSIDIHSNRSPVVMGDSFGKVSLHTFDLNVRR